jgi:hypothetical protein
MPTFEEFVQIELPKRPFCAGDGLPGQVLVRSSNPQAVRELVWADAAPGGGGSGGAGSGEILDGGDRMDTNGALFDGGSRL